MDDMDQHDEFRHLPGIDLYLWLRLVLAVLLAVGGLSLALG